jgi:hypothetical protein
MMTTLTARDSMEAHEPRPLYRDCNRSQALTAWCGAAANGMVITWLGLWLVIHYVMVDRNFVGLVIAVFLALLFLTSFLDLCTGQLIPGSTRSTGSA